jgi:hypothetical protein
MNNSDMPAMPNTNPETYPTPCPINYGHGLTKREHFAGLAMQGWLARCGNTPHSVKLEPDVIAAVALSMADALLAELDKGVR